MSRGDWIKHALVFVGAVFMVWLSGVVPVLILKPGPYTGMSDAQVLAAMGNVDLMGILRAWPIYIAIGICQALTFHYVKRFATPVFLAGVFIVGALFAWRFWSSMA
jgi:hypothetical protein